ncbi:cell division protein FtsL [Solilutibacter silvestris]|uniref:Cell division protein FtsL n=1 Tax=Solilutibacter silvestris TaxID=1645665 RepID=A0A2K1Q2L0_9GAMM|nr:cell division protein FtsL [Lysobacter silvestris]PNS09275.1 cell division protein FtsL [Lysobacter silvestris]
MSGWALFGLLLIANVASGIAVSYDRFEHRQLFSKLSKLEKARDELDLQFSQLQLEQATWAEPTLIDRAAREHLHMDNPRPEDTVVVRQ